MSSRLAIFSIDSNDGCEELVHHFETVVGAQPNCSANHLLVFFFSAKINFQAIQISCFFHVSFYIVWRKDNKLFSKTSLF